RGEPLPMRLEEAGGSFEVLEPKHRRTPLGPADILYHSWQSGAGYGDPLDRDPEAVLRDVLDLAVSLKAARDIYGVVLKGGTVDEGAREVRRGVTRRERLGREPKTFSSREGGRRIGDSLCVAEDDSAWCRRCGE